MYYWVSLLTLAVLLTNEMWRIGCSYVLGSYAHFLWAADDDEEGENQEEAKTPPPLVEAR